MHYEVSVPTVGDRTAQMLVKMTIEPSLEAIFMEDSYGYRPNKSAHQALEVTRKRCWKYDFVLEFDIVGLFDNISHELLLKAARKHIDSKWALLYIERWLKAPMKMPDGQYISRDKGTPQGGVVSPCLSNLFLHYAFDFWMQRNFPNNPWCRYADDGLVHCKSEQEALEIRCALEKRFAECGLAMHPDKTKIAYCKDSDRKGLYENTAFDFLGYTFRSRLSKNSKTGKLFVNFTPAVSSKAKSAMRSNTRKWDLRNRADLSLSDIANMYNPILRGWLEYYGKYHRSAMYPVMRHFNQTLVAWAMKKHKKLRGHKTRAGKYMQKIAEQQPKLFSHWKVGMVGSFC